MKHIIIGAVAGGASAAARLRRLDEKAEIVIFERGEYMSYANCGLPYYIGEVIRERNKLFVQNATSFKLRYNIDVRIRTEVLRIDRIRKTVFARNLEDGVEYEESYDKLLLSPGAAPIVPPFPGKDLDGIFSLRNVADTDKIKGYINQVIAKNKALSFGENGGGNLNENGMRDEIGNENGAAVAVGKAVVVGGGFIGIEMAENLRHLGMKVSLVELGNQVLAPLDFTMVSFVQQHLREMGVELWLQQAVTGFEKTTKGLNVMLKSGDKIEADVVVLSIGVKPDSHLAEEAGLQVGLGKAITVNEFLQTSDPDIYAVGDAIEFKNPISGQIMPTYLAGPANKQGRIVANNMVLGNKEKYKGAINTAIVKVFDLTAGTTGLSAKALKKLGIPYLVSTTHSASHATYYPDSAQMSIQLTFSAEGKIYGAQIVGKDGVDKRLDVMAQIIQNEGGIEDLMEFEHAYAPPYSSAKDPVNMAGFVAENILLKKLKVITWDDLGEIQPTDLLIDVRNPDEFASGTIPNAINIPVDEIRGRLNELPKEKNIYIFCQIGLRGYLAQRILLQNGFEKVKNIGGGYKLWKSCQAEFVNL